ncbi:MAG: putative quinol monooxygenase [Campylobacterota bacterium]|nr:putative quinol monooxygenase [Campylobacterota bacterium]
MNITKKVTFIAKDAHIEQLKGLLESMVSASRAEVGCLKYNIYQIESEPTKFIVIEAWENEDALDGHKNSKHYKHYKSNYEVHTADKFSENLLIVGEAF